MNVEPANWAAPPIKSDVPLGNALRSLFYAGGRELSPELDRLLARLMR
jgi:hypothetical protein